MSDSKSDARTRLLKPGEAGGDGPVLLWMQRAQRAEFNHALNLAVALANGRGRRAIVYFGLTDGYPGANLRHYRFMLEGLAETSRRLRKRGLGMVMRLEDPSPGICRLARETGACAVVTDMGCLPLHRRWRSSAAEGLDVPFYQVDTDSVVPLEEVSRKEEYAARTIRPKIMRLLPSFLERPNEPLPRKDSLDRCPAGENAEDVDGLLRRLETDAAVPASPLFHGGRAAALQMLEAFLRDGLKGYHETARDPVADATSHLSPYLHFGQISPLEVALEAASLPGEGSDAFMEQLVVRRGLARNMTFHNGSFRRIGALPDWARGTLAEHAEDRRQHLYSLEELESASTSDPYWNAAQGEMTATGRMHNYMRMYWGKRILEWSPSPQEALDRILYLNDRWELDGRDPGGYAGALWCLGKHDRAWKERPVVGKVRWMSPAGLERKFDIDAYVRRVDGLKPNHGTQRDGGTD